ncbi:MAG: lipid IV(A) 3-deoxy-D-manno-octulosonic acid transferase [Burkholderiales bacterium]
MLTRRAYSLLAYAAVPFLPLRLWWRGRREPGYREHIGERFGRYGDLRRPAGEVLWVHAVSLGETRAAAPLVERLARERPQATILLTHMTATGREAGRSLLPGRMVQAWLPYDVPFAVAAFLEHFAPRACLLMETELWPNVVAASTQRGIPVFLVNARLSARSLSGYRRFAALTQPMFASLAGAAAQTEADAGRLREAGAREVAVTGNLKYDVAVPPSAVALGATLRARFGSARPVFVAASTRNGEEALLLDALARGPLPGNALTVIVPRHPQRFDAVAQLLAARGLRHVRRSADVPVADDVAVVLGDSLGELFAYYAAADVAFVGGSLLPLGGQNLIEPIAAGTPTLVGPHTFNFADAAKAAVAAGAAVRVADADALVAEVGALLWDAPRRAQMRDAASGFMAAHRGAVERLWAWLAPRMKGGGGTG